MLSEASYDRLVGGIYDAALDSRVWPQVIADLCDAFGIPYASIYTPFCNMVGLEPIWSANVDPEFIELWPKYAPGDVLTQALWRKLPSDAFTYSTGDLYPREKLKNWDAYVEVWQPRGVGELVGILVNGEDHRAGTLNLYYPEIDEDDIAAAKGAVSRLGQHIARSLKIHWHVTNAKLAAGAAQYTLDLFQMGAAWLDPAGTCLFCNTEMKRILELDDGIGISEQGQLLLSKRADFTAAIQKASEGIETIFTVVRRSGAEPFRLRMMPLPLRAESFRLPGSAAILFASESVPPLEEKIARAQKLFGLTPAEARLLKHLIQGHDASGAAREIGVQVGTVRTQIKALLSKCGAARQADLIRIVAYLP